MRRRWGLVAIAAVVLVGSVGIWLAADPGARENPARQEVFEGVAVVLTEFGIEESEVVDGASLAEDLDVDCLDRLELTMELEDAFGITISDDEIRKLRTVGQTVDLVAARAEENAPLRQEAAVEGLGWC